MLARPLTTLLEVLYRRNRVLKAARRPASVFLEMYGRNGRTIHSEASTWEFQKIDSES